MTVIDQGEFIELPDPGETIVKLNSGTIAIGESLQTARSAEVTYTPATDDPFYITIDPSEGCDIIVHSREDGTDVDVQGERGLDIDPFDLNVRNIRPPNAIIGGGGGFDFRLIQVPTEKLTSDAGAAQVFKLRTASPDTLDSTVLEPSTNTITAESPTNLDSTLSVV